MRERIDANDLRLWRDTALALGPLTGGRLSRERILKDLAQRVKTLKVRDPGGRGDGFGSLDFKDVTSPTLTAVHVHGSWLFLDEGNRFTGSAYSAGSAGEVRVFELCGLTVNRAVGDGRMGQWKFANATLHDVPEDLLAEMLDLFLDVVLPLSTAAHTVRSAVHKYLVPGPLPARVREKLKDAFKREDALLLDAFKPALRSREELSRLEAGVLAALEHFSRGTAVGAQGAADEFDADALPGPDTAFGRIAHEFARNVLTALDQLDAVPGLTAEERTAVRALTDFVHELAPGASAAHGRRVGGGGDAMSKLSFYGLRFGYGTDGDEWGGVNDHDAALSVTSGNNLTASRTAPDPTQRDLSHVLVTEPMLDAAADADEVNRLGYGPLVYLQRAVEYLDDHQGTAHLHAARYVLEVTVAADGLPFDVDVDAKLAEEAGVDRTGRVDLARRDSVAGLWRDHVEGLLRSSTDHDEWRAFTRDDVDGVVDLTVFALMNAANTAYDDFCETLQAQRADGSLDPAGGSRPHH